MSKEKTELLREADTAASLCYGRAIDLESDDEQSELFNKLGDVFMSMVAVINEDEKRLKELEGKDG